MANVGRFVCVLVPFALTLASLIAMLVAGLAGVTDKNLYIFKVNTTDLSISTSSLSSLLSDRDVPPLDRRSPLGSEGPTATTGGGSSRRSDGSSWSGIYSSATAAVASATSSADAASIVSSAVSGSNVTASDLGLADAYYINLWNYCQTTSTGGRKCTTAQFNWAANATDSFTSSISSVASASGANFTLPSSIQSAMNTFGTVTKWTEVVFIIAYVALGAELLFGIFANCSRAFSCITWLVAGVATVAVCAAAALATVMASVVVGVVESTAKYYGVSASLNTSYLAAVWVGAAFALAAGFFWMFTVCCCKPDHGSKGGFGRKRHLDDESGEKLMPMSGPYQPIGDTQNHYYGQTQGATQYGGPRYPATGRSDMAYEPYSHNTRV